MPFLLPQPAPGGGGGGNLPAAPTIKAVQADQTAAHIWIQPGSNGGSVITKHTAVSTPGGLVGTSDQMIDSGNGTLIGVSGRITVNGLTPGQQYTFKVYSTNANGDGAQSAASGQITAATQTDFWFYHGYAQGIQNSRPCIEYFANLSGGNTFTNNVSVPTGGGGPTTVPAGTTCVYVHDPNHNLNWSPSVLHGMNPDGTYDSWNNGRLNTPAWTYFSFRIWPVSTPFDLFMNTWIERFYNGVCGAGSGAGVIVDPTASWPTNYWSSAGALAWNLTNAGSPPGITSNTATQINCSGATFNPGDLYEVGIADLVWGANISSLGPFRTGGSTFVSGQWNTVNIPITTFDYPGATYGPQMPSQSQLLKMAFAPEYSASMDYYLTDYRLGNSLLV